MEDAVDDAACDEIVVASGYFFGSELTLNVDRDLVIRGAGSAVTTLNYHMLVTNNAVLTLENLSIDGDGLGAQHGVELSSNAAGVIGTNIKIFGSLGWGIENTFGVNTANTFAILTDCAIFGNAGGINVASLTMNRCDIYGNNVHGGIALFDDSTILYSNIYNNQQSNITDDGAGVLFEGFSDATLLIEHSKIHGNTTHIISTNAVADGGGIMVRRGNATIRYSDIYDNLAARRGGGIAVHDIFDASLTVENSTIRDNVAYEGGGGISVGNDATIRDSDITNNTTRYDINFNINGLGSGGGVYVYGSPDLQIYDTTINLNITDSASAVLPVNSGGGIFAAPDFLGGSIWIERSTISENYAQKEGGGVYAREGTTLHNVTIANNYADGSGGGLYGDDTVTLQHTTVVGNVADFDNDGSGDGGGLAGVIRTDHTLIALNDDLSSPSLADCSGGNIQSFGYSLLSVGDGCENFKQTGTDLVGDSGGPIDPVLILPLANNGGKTHSIALDLNSPAVDAGSPSCGGATIDQRGGTRPLDGDESMTLECDIGAIELRPDSCNAGPVVITGPEFFAGQSQVSSTTTLSTTGEVVIVAGSMMEFIADDTGSINFGSGFKVEPGSQFRAILRDTRCSL